MKLICNEHEVPMVETETTWYCPKCHKGEHSNFRAIDENSGHFEDKDILYLILLLFGLVLGGAGVVHLLKIYGLL